ncbi:MAG: nucleotidyltransferase family protein, partial [Bacteroidia bacterium]
MSNGPPRSNGPPFIPPLAWTLLLKPSRRLPSVLLPNWLKFATGNLRLMQSKWAIILAAGSSRRMGSQKLLMPYGKGTIIETVVDQVLNSKVGQVVVVLGADHDKVRRALGERPVKFCHNTEHEKGMFSSVICGLRSVPTDAEAVLIYLGDQPGIPPAVTNAVIEAYNDELYGIVIPVHMHRRGHPLLVDLKYRKEIEKLDLEQGLRA